MFHYTEVASGLSVCTFGLDKWCCQWIEQCLAKCHAVTSDHMCPVHFLNLSKFGQKTIKL